MALQEEFEKQGNWLFIRRSYIPLILLAIAFGLYVNKELHPSAFCLENTVYEYYYELACLLVGIAGLVVRIYTVGFTPKNTSGRNTKEGQVADTLNSTGIYSVVRHPLYLGNFLMWLGPVMLTGNFWFIISFILFYYLYYERIMFSEEQFLRKKFGDRYLQWAENVPAFIPNLRLFKQSDLYFSWKKVLKKEKNGLFALFLIFCFFNTSGEYAKNETNYNYFFIYMSGITGVGYFILKAIKMYSGILDEQDR